jgi:predicted O-methyltransferase YrrM
LGGRILAAAARTGVDRVDETLLVLLEKLAKDGEENDARQTERAKRMLNITCDTGRFLWILARAIAATRILEVGASNGFSTIWLADAARSNGGRVTSLEVDAEKISLARANLAAAGLEDVVELIEGQAADTLPTLPGPFDLVFLDADRSSYLAYLDIVVPKLRSGGLLIADNATSHAGELQDFLARVKSHPELFAVTVPIGKGEEVAVKFLEYPKRIDEFETHAGRI